MKKTFTLLFLTTLLLCNLHQSFASSGLKINLVKTDSVKNVTTKWNFTDSQDKLTGKPTFLGVLLSENTLTFKFPYDGGALGAIVVSNSNKTNEVGIKVTKGQFYSSSDDKTIKVRFDDRKIMTFVYFELSNGTTDTIYLLNPKGFINQLKNSHSLIIEAEFYQDGTNDMEFKTDGFVWNH